MKRLLSFLLAFVIVFTGAMQFGVIQAGAETGDGNEISTGIILNPSNIAQGEYSESFEYNGFTVTANAERTVTVVEGKAATNEMSFDNRLYFYGGGNADYRSIKFTTTSAATLIFYGVSSSNTQARNIGIATYDERRGKLVDVETVVMGSALDKFMVSLPEADTYYIYSHNSGFNLFYLEVSYENIEVPKGRESYDTPEFAPDFKEGDLYVSVNGTSKSSGTFEDPMDLLTAINEIPAGNTIWMFGGTYYIYDLYRTRIYIEESNSGTADAYKKISSINGRKVVLDFDGFIEYNRNKGVILEGSYWHFYDIDICNAGSHGLLIGGNNNIIELCKFYRNCDSGLQISRINSDYTTVDMWPANNLILNCTSYDNFDSITLGENADGFAPKLTCGEGNVFDGCIAYCNSDDGWDMYCKPETGSIGSVTLKNCVTFGNGTFTNGVPSDGNKNGYKLGGMGFPSPHIVENCLAFDNGAKGFDDNNNGGAITLKNCTSVNNVTNYMCSRASKEAEYYNLVSYSDTITETDNFMGTISYAIRAHKTSGYQWIKNWYSIEKIWNTYTGAERNDYTISQNDFVNVTVLKDANGNYSLDYHELFRNSDGSINLDGLYEIKETSPLYTAGSDGSCIGANFSSGVNISTKYTVTVVAEGNGTVTSSVPKVAPGATVTLAATPNEGYEFDSWIVVSGGVEVAEDGTFIMPASAVEVKAIFKAASTGDNPGENPVVPPVEPTPGDTVEAFVARMYTIALEREVDPTGHADWVAGLEAGRYDGATVGRGVFLSPEFVNKNLSNEEFLNRLYSTFFNRPADEAGYANWMNHLNAGFSREFVLSNFVNSQEFMNLCNEFSIERGTLLENGDAVNVGMSQFVTRLYDVVLLRTPDKDGYNDWTTKLGTGEMSVADVAASFFGSQEYIQKNKSDVDFLTDVYSAFFDRDPDEAGMNNWLANFVAGTVTRDNIFGLFTVEQEWLNLLAKYGL